MATSNYFLSLSVLAIIIMGNVAAGARYAPASSAELAGIAWTLATSPDATKRDGATAVRYARKACRQTGYLQPAIIGILASAYAEDGLFDKAIYAVQFSDDLAAKSGDTNTLQMNHALLKFYQNHQPYHEGSTKSTLNGQNEPVAKRYQLNQ